MSEEYFDKKKKPGRNYTSPEINRETMKRIKALDREQLSKWVVTIYSNGYNDGLNDGTVDMDKAMGLIQIILKEELGIGPARFEKVESRLKYALLGRDVTKEDLVLSENRPYKDEDGNIIKDEME